MKLIKPLLIYIIWIAFVWLCIGFIHGHLINVFATTFSRASFVFLLLISALFIAPLFIRKNTGTLVSSGKINKQVDIYR